MEIELIKKLIEKCEKEGQAKYRFYVLKKENNDYRLSMKDKEMALFHVTGYEQGDLIVNNAKTDYQVTTVNHLTAYLLGNY
jgi:hypothetical protein